jgi:hypothetical protein
MATGYYTTTTLQNLELKMVTGYYTTTTLQNPLAYCGFAQHNSKHTRLKINQYIEKTAER